MNDYKLDLEKYATLARQAAAEGCVLLENEKQALPLREGESVAVFGRMAFHYYKSGLGSGGLVNTRYVVGILDALKECKEIQLDEKLLGIYANWIKENPYDEGQGWGRVPWSQKEMEVTEEMLDCARSNDVSLIIIGRTAGEDQDNNTNPGSYCLTETEEDLICRVCEVSKCTVVVLNVGNIIDMSWVEKYHPQAVLYAWQGGQEGGNGVADVLTGKVCACGKLTDTIAERIEYYPSTENLVIHIRIIIRKIFMWVIVILRHLRRIRCCIRLDMVCPIRILRQRRRFLRILRMNSQWLRRLPISVM